MSTLHQLALTRLPGVGPVLARKLLEHYGHAEAVFRESENDLLALPGFGKRIARSFGTSVVFTALKEADAELEFIDQAGLRLLNYKYTAYPSHQQNLCE